MIRDAESKAQPIMKGIRTRVVSVPEGAAAGDTVTVDGRAHLVLHLLPRIRGRSLAARVTRNPPCRLCEAALLWASSGWWCSSCRDTPTSAELVEWSREHLQDAKRAGKARREGGRRWQRAERWRAELGIATGALPTDWDYHTAASARDWKRAELVARIALQDGARLTAVERAAWRERRDVARRYAAGG